MTPLLARGQQPRKRGHRPASGDASENLRLAPGTDLPSLAQACTKFHHILHTDSIWRRCCREEYGVCEILQNLKMIGMSYREVYVKLLHPYRNILGLWQLDRDYGTLLNVVVGGLCITGGTCRPSHNTHVDDPMQFKPSFRIRLTERKSATLEYLDDFYSFSHSRHLQIRKDRFSIQWIQRDHRMDLPPQIRRERGLELVREDRQQYDWVTYRRLYLPPSHPGDLIRPGLFQFKDESFRPKKIAILSFHGKYARVTEIRGGLIWTFEIHLRRGIQLQDGQIFRNFNELSRMVREIDEQVIREQQQQEDGTKESQGHGWQSPAQPSVGEMCFYGVHNVILSGFHNLMRLPGVVILFDENHLGFISLEEKYFILLGRVQNIFQNVEAPSPQAFLEMLWNIQSRHPVMSSFHAL
ncbi:F-box only protein 31-like [Myotis yumanensis]|uniref:F-box only protein 31-like n=1 Tax=Myotis yumanensis TaxID=159337 RepID=UPI0038D36E1D